MLSSKMLENLKEFLPDECLLPGTSVKEKGIEVSIEKLSSEIIHFFHTDHKEAKKCLNIVDNQTKNKSTCSDYLIFYTCSPDVKEVLCFLELKGGDFSHAANQIINTYRHFCKVPLGMDNGTNGEHVCAAAVCLRGGVLQADDKAKMKLVKEFGKGRVHVKHISKKKYTELAVEFLRKIV